MDLDRARVVADVAQTIINTAKVEVDFFRMAGGTVTSGSGFIPVESAPGNVPRLVKFAGDK